MHFEEENDYGKTNYNAAVPKDLMHLLMSGFSHKYVMGPWGWYLSIWIETEVCTFWIHYINRNYKGKMFASVAMTIFALHHLVDGNALGMLNGEHSVQLSMDRSHFFIVPGGFQQEVELNKGMTVSMHADFKRGYLDQNKQHYAALQPLLQQYDQSPDRAFHEVMVIHNHWLEHSWISILEQLPAVANPVLFVDAQVRELLRRHYEQLEAKLLPSQVSLQSSGISDLQKRAAEEARLLVEKDISVHYRIKDLARKVNLNEFDLKRVFKQVYKTTIHQHLLHLRMEFAREQLLSTTKTIQQIAASVGFSSPSNFNRLFKRTFGETPVSLRAGKYKKRPNGF